MGRFLIAAAHKSSGKTTLAIGLCAAFRERGSSVRPFKKGPDYIDPLWLGRAAGQACINLDFNTMSPVEIEAAYWPRAMRADTSIVEANKGLYDGLAVDGSNSNAALAQLLQTPVVLVIDCRGMTRGIAPLLLGYRAFGPEIQFAGVILNRVGGTRHAGKLRAAVETYTDFTVLGSVQEDPDLHIQERHLGLIPSNEHGAAERRIATLAQHIRQQVHLDALDELGRGMRMVNDVRPTLTPTGQRVRIAVARDAAFGFYYAADLEALERGGAELRFFDTLQDTRLPEADALFIGGGFPEMHMHQLARNTELRGQIRAVIEAGLPAYAECGGLMYLSQGISWQGSRHPMVGVLPGETWMSERPIGKGYVHLEETSNMLWPPPESAGRLEPSRRKASGPRRIAAHEFHYSHFTSDNQDLRYAYKVLRGHGVDGRQDGIVHRNLLASYTHLHHSESHPWTSRFLQFIRGIMGAHSPAEPHGSSSEPDDASSATPTILNRNHA